MILVRVWSAFHTSVGSDNRISYILFLTKPFHFQICDYLTDNY